MPKEDFLAAQIEDFFNQGLGYGLSLSVLQNGSWQHFSKGHLDWRGLELNQKTYFDIASLTKTFTATLALHASLVEGDFDLDDPISRFLPDWRRNFDRITIRHLLSHTSGLWRNFSKPTPGSTTVEELYRQILDPNSFELKNPGQTNYFDYFILEKVFQARLDLILQKFLNDFGLTNITYNPLVPRPNPQTISQTATINPKQIKPEKGKLNIAASSQAADFGQPHDEKARILNRPTGHAGLFATHQALVKWTEAWLNNRFQFSQKLYQEAFGSQSAFKSWQVEDELYGLVWRRGRYSLTYHNHAGFTGPAIFLRPQTQTAIVLTCNHLAKTETLEQRQKYIAWLRNFSFD